MFDKVHSAYKESSLIALQNNNKKKKLFFFETSFFSDTNSPHIAVEGGTSLDDFRKPRSLLRTHTRWKLCLPCAIKGASETKSSKGLHFQLFANFCFFF